MCLHFRLLSKQPHLPLQDVLLVRQISPKTPCPHPLYCRKVTQNSTVVSQHLFQMFTGYHTQRPCQSFIIQPLSRSQFQSPQFTWHIPLMPLSPLFTWHIPLTPLSPLFTWPTQHLLPFIFLILQLQLLIWLILNHCLTTLHRFLTTRHLSPQFICQQPLA